MGFALRACLNPAPFLACGVACFAMVLTSTILLHWRIQVPKP